VLRTSEEGERLRVELAREEEERQEDVVVKVGERGGSSWEEVSEVGSEVGEGKEVVGVEVASREEG